MKMTAIIPTMLYIFFASCLPGYATPPDIINVRDEIFGVSERKIFLLRITYDNLGLYDAEQRDVVLVALDRRTQEEISWPVYRARTVPDYERDETGTTSRVDQHSLLDAVDPFEILGEFDGMPVGTKIRGYEVAANLKFEEDTILVSYDNGTVFRADMDNLSQGLTVSLGALADLIGDYDRVAPVQTRDLLGALTFLPDQCRITDTRRFDLPLGKTPSLVARLTCDDDAGQLISLLVLIPSA